MGGDSEETLGNRLCFSSISVDPMGSSDRQKNSSFGTERNLDDASGRIANVLQHSSR